MNTNPQTIMDRMTELNVELSKRNSELHDLAEKVAENEKTYKILVAEETLEQKRKGLPITIIKDVVNGNRAVAEARKDLYIAEAVYKIASEKMRDIRSHIDTLRSFLTWLRMELMNSGFQDNILGKRD